MTYPDQIPRTSELITAAIEGLIGGLSGEARERRAAHAIHGRFGDVIRGWRGQVEIARARLAREMIATRLIPANSGQSLRELAESEYEAVLPAESRKAEGEFVLVRTKTNASPSDQGNFLAGVIKAGHRFRRPGDPTYLVPLEDAQYEATEAVVCSPHDSSPPVAVNGQYVHTQRVTVQVRSVREGVHANTPELFGVTLPPGQIVDKMFDLGQPQAERFVTESLRASGGTAGAVDAQIIALARAMAQGFDGPTVNAALAGSLTDPGVRRVLPFQDPTTAVLRLFAADETWSMSDRHRAMVKQSLYAYPWIGFGCRVDVNRVVNYPITVRLEVILRSNRFDSDRSEITAAIRKKLQEYFDDRPDFNIWRTNTIGGLVSTADRRILACRSAQVLDAAGVAVPEPSSSITGGSSTIYHWLLVREGADVNYVAPS